MRIRKAGFWNLTNQAGSSKYSGEIKTEMLRESPNTSNSPKNSSKQTPCYRNTFLNRFHLQISQSSPNLTIIQLLPLDGSKGHCRNNILGDSALPLKILSFLLVLPYYPKFYKGKILHSESPQPLKGPPPSRFCHLQHRTGIYQGTLHLLMK